MLCAGRLSRSFVILEATAAFGVALSWRHGAQPQNERYPVGAALGNAIATETNSCTLDDIFVHSMLDPRGARARMRAVRGGDFAKNVSTVPTRTELKQTRVAFLGCRSRVGGFSTKRALGVSCRRGGGYLSPGPSVARTGCNQPPPDKCPHQSLRTDYIYNGVIEWGTVSSSVAQYRL